MDHWLTPFSFSDCLLTIRVLLLRALSPPPKTGRALGWVHGGRGFAPSMDRRRASPPGGTLFGEVKAEWCPKRAVGEVDTTNQKTGSNSQADSVGQSGVRTVSLSSSYTSASHKDTVSSRKAHVVRCQIPEVSKSDRSAFANIPVENLEMNTSRVSTFKFLPITSFRTSIGVTPKTACCARSHWRFVSETNAYHVVMAYVSRGLAYVRLIHIYPASCSTGVSSKEQDGTRRGSLCLPDHVLHGLSHGVCGL